MERVMNTSLGAHLMMLCWALLVGGSFPLAATLDQSLSPVWLTAVRFFIAAGLMLPWVTRGEGWLPRTRKAWFSYTLLGSFLAAFFGSQFWALNLTSALSVAALFVTLPSLAWMMATLVRIERSGVGRLLVLIVGAAGALGLTLQSRVTDGTEWAGFGAGEWLFLAGCACSAAYSVSSRVFVLREWLPENPLLATFWSLLIGAALLLLLTPFQAQTGVQFWQLLGVDDLLVLALLALFGSFMTFWILQSAMQVLMPSSVAAYCYLTPLVSLALVLHEGSVQPGLLTWASLGLLLFTVGCLIGSERGSPAG
ncbi:DMT family transporter [Marinobacterium litorale]|uniref:DMT family transporter n=1 Tax=Marinobacterium litorale TaxID=404770 RepID=UPI00040D05B9|nr:DMT family transporter [Marinobacterium litorale]